jgi:hypothetical protein
LIDLALYESDELLLDEHLLDGSQQTAQDPVHFVADVVCNVRFLQFRPKQIRSARAYIGKDSMRIFPAGAASFTKHIAA